MPIRSFENSPSARKYRRVRRLYDELTRQYVMGNEKGIFSQDREDAEAVEQTFSQFFTECYHLKDWIKKDKLLPVAPKQDIETYINSCRNLSLACDVANGQKHLTLDKRPRISRDVSLNITPLLSGPIGTYPIGGIYKFIISVKTDSQNNEIDALKLADECVTAWEVFLNKYNVSFG